MAADTRPYKSKEQDGQGNEVIIRDQQLVEQITVTTMPSGACFETLDIDGRPVKIPRDNMISIVLECMGIVLNDSSKNLGTNVNKALGLQGNTIGNVIVSDLASVLGGTLMFNGTISDSFTSINKAGSWFVDSSASNGPSHTPSSGGWYVLAFHTHSTYHLCLLAYTSNGDGAIYMGEEYIGNAISWNRIKTEKLP